jgi:hypothetical protein
VAENVEWTMKLRVGALLLFLAAAFPKAGFSFRDIPMPVMFITLFGGLLLVSARRQRPISIDVALVALFVWAVFIALRVTITSTSLRETVALMGWLVLPLTIIALSSARTLNGRVTVSALLAGVRFAALYGIAQLIFGFKRVEVHGLTQAWGSDFDDNYLEIFEGSSVAFWKIPATYHNGNIFGVVAACAFAIALTHPKLYRSPRWAILDIALFSSAILLSGSRTVFIGWVVSIFFCLMYREVANRAQTPKLLAIVIAAGLVTLAVQPGLITRFAPSSLTDPTGAGRTQFWFDVIGDFNVLDWIIGSTAWLGPSPFDSDSDALRGGLAEGWVGVTQQIGLIGFALLVIVWIRFVRPVNAGYAIAIPIAISLVLDSAYLSFPTLFLPAALLAGLVAFDNPDGEPEPDTTHWWTAPLSLGSSADST